MTQEQAVWVEVLQNFGQNLLFLVKGYRHICILYCLIKTYTTIHFVYVYGPLTYMCELNVVEYINSPFVRFRAFFVLTTTICLRNGNSSVVAGGGEEGGVKINWLILTKYRLRYLSFWNLPSQLNGGTLRHDVQPTGFDHRFSTSAV